MTRELRSETDELAGDPTLRDTEEALARSRERLAASLGALREDLSGLRDWREWVRMRPLTFAAGALGLGLLVGLAGRRG